MSHKPDGKGFIASLRRSCHLAAHRITILFEHACAGAYAIHEVFHFTTPILITAYGLLLAAFLSGVTFLLTRGA